jgi:hypothetical protein
MQLSRRTLLKGTAALGAMALPAVGLPKLTSAQSPQYELVDVTTFEESVTINGTPSYGHFQEISNTGQICGSMVADGLQKPALWSADGEMTLLQEGPNGALAHGLNNLGDAVGVMYLDSAGAVSMPVYWREGAIYACPVPAAIAGTENTGGAYSINDDSMIAGNIGPYPVRWHGETGEIMASVLEGGSYLPLAISPNGTVAGWVGNQDALGWNYFPFVWMPDGQGRLLENAPSPVSGDSRVSTVTHDGLGSVADSGDFAVAVFQNGIDDAVSVIYRGGVATILPDLASSNGSLAKSANTAGIVAGNAVYGGITDYDWRAVLWIDGQPFDLNDLLAEPSDLLLTSAVDINDRGEIAVRATDPSGVRHGVVLRPVS